MRARLFTAFLALILTAGVALWVTEQTIQERYNPNKMAEERDSDILYPIAQGDASVAWQREGWFINAMNVQRRGVDHLLDNETYGDDGSNRKRVLLVGDSFVYGTGVANPDDMLGERLEDELNKAAGGNAFDVQVLGLHGASTMEEAEWLTDELLEEIDPDLIVVGFVPNDVVPSGREAALCGSDLFCDQSVTSTDLPEYAACLNGEAGILPKIIRYSIKPFFPLVAETMLSRFCDLGRIASETSTQSYADLVAVPSEGPYWKYFLTALDRFAEINTAIPVTFSPLYPEYDRGETRDFVINTIRERGITVSEMSLSYEAVYQARSTRNLWVNPVDAHPNRYLNELFAEDIVAALTQNYRWIGDAPAGDVEPEPLVVTSIPVNPAKKNYNDLIFRETLSTQNLTYRELQSRDGTTAAAQNTTCVTLGSPHVTLYLHSGLPVGQRLETRLHSAAETATIVDVHTMLVDRNSKVMTRKVGELRVGEAVSFTLNAGERAVLYAPRGGSACNDPAEHLSLSPLDIELALR